jgi:hypothetical protein
VGRCFTAYVKKNVENLLAIRANKMAKVYVEN